MGDLSSRGGNCCDNNCGCGNGIFGGNGCNWIWIILLLSCCCGNGNGIFGGNGCGCGCDNGCGNDSCLWIILLLFCCGGWGSNGCGNGCNHGCGNSCC